MLFDSHAHIDVEDFNEDRDEMMKAAQEAGVSYVVNPGVDLESSLRAIEMANRYPGVYAMVGYYPQETRFMTYELLEKIEELSKEPKVVAIGEIGLDYYWEDTPHDVQQKWFREQIRLAEKLDMPIAIHDREAHGDVLRILKEEKAFDRIRVLMHCYSGSAEFAKELLALGCYFSISGVVTYKNNKKAQGVIDVIPLDHMCIETDSPYLTPVPFRGKRNDPSRVVYTARKIAEMKGISFEEVAQATCETAKRFYGIDQ